MVQNKTLVLGRIPTGLPVPGEDLLIKETEFDTNASPPQGGFTTQNGYGSLDPGQRGRMRDPTIRSYSSAYPVGGPVTTTVISKVLKSDTERFQPGDMVVGHLPLETYSRVGSEQVQGFTLLQNPMGLPTEFFLGPLGLAGLTAYSSLYSIGRPKKGETIFISAASGGTGQVVGQIAKREGLKVIGSVGSDEKLEFIIHELGFDGGFNYKKEKPDQALKRLAPQGIDIYYDNVQGEQLDAAFEHLNDYGRIIACGSMTFYNPQGGEIHGLKNTANIVKKRLLMQGFIVFDQHLGPAYADEHQKRMQQWIMDGDFKTKIAVFEGIDNAATSLVAMLQGHGFGKVVLKISDL